MTHARPCVVCFPARAIDRSIDRELSFRERVFVTLDDPASSGLARLLSIAILVLIVVSVVALVCESAFVRAPAGRGCEICGDAAKQEECRDGGDDTLATCLATCGACEPEALPIFAVLEFIFIPLFTLEYLLQVSDGGRIRPPPSPERTRHSRGAR